VPPGKSKLPGGSGPSGSGPAAGGTARQG